MAAPSRPRHIYRGEAIRCIAFPLGGLGTGSVALGGDGSLRQWQLGNRINHLACVPHSFFAIWAQSKQPNAQPVARVLQSGALYKTTGPTPPPTSNDHLVPEAHQHLLETLPGVATTEFIGEYPIAEITYHDPNLSVEVRLEAFSPFIPLNASDSGLPAIFFNFTVRNPTDSPISISLAATLQNSVGWDGLAPISQTACSLYHDNQNTLIQIGALTAIEMSSPALGKLDANFGSLVLSTPSSQATYKTQWSQLAEFWSDFAADGKLNEVDSQRPSPVGQTWNGALAVPFDLAPQASHTVTFFYTWHFPNRYFNYDTPHTQHLLGFEDNKSQFWIGNAYSRRFDSAYAVAEYVEANHPQLANLTRLARDTFYATTLPASVIDTVTSQISILRSPTCFWDFEGNFYGYEGCSGASTPNTSPQGSCPLNCTHVWNYEMALARLFPDLERTMRETEWSHQQHSSGYLPHRVRLPLYLPRAGEYELVGPNRAALDGLLGGILKTYRDYRACGDLTWLRQMWAGVKRALTHLWAVHDPEQRGVITGEQPNTYDISIYGLNPFIGTLYLAALHASAAMAERLGPTEDELRANCLAAFDRGRRTLEEHLWNGDYYQQEVDLAQHPEQNWASGCHSDQLLGQWWAYQLSLGRLLPSAHLHQAVQAIDRHNFRENFHNHVQHPRVYAANDSPGLLICTWPQGGRPAVPTQYSDEVWTGLEYEVAALLLYEGEPASALRILDAVHTRYDGRQQNLWNNIECGDHYVRALSSWSLLEAASGFNYDAGQASLEFAPTLSPAEYQAPFVSAEGWGSFTQRLTDKRQTVKLHIAFGSLQLQSLKLKTALQINTVWAQIGGHRISVSLIQTGSTVTLAFSRPLSLVSHNTLTINLTGASTTTGKESYESH